MIQRFLTILFALILTYALPAAAQEKSAVFSLPVDCVIGTDCWIVNYTDVDPSAKVRDYTCGTRSYNDHKGTDFAIRDYLAMQTGVNVLAAADGKVLRLRDGVDDWPPVKSDTYEQERKDILDKKLGCGNGVFIEHEGGYTGIYCHLKKDSITVKRGQDIKRGDILGQIGFSGFTEFPHLHFGLFKDSQIIDPFTSATATDGCDMPRNRLWDQTIPHDDENIVSFFGGGFKTTAPDFDALGIDASSPDKIAIDSDIISFWVGLYGVRQNDVIEMDIRDPNGEIYVSRAITQPSDKVRQYYFIGKKTRNHPLLAGSYKAAVTVTRTDKNGYVQQDHFNISTIVE